jgi:hypothetical protein
MNTGEVMKKTILNLEIDEMMTHLSKTLLEHQLIGVGEDYSIL